MGSSSNRYAPRLPQQETKSSTKLLALTDPILGPENLLKTGFTQKGLPSCPSGRHKPQSLIETKIALLQPQYKKNKNQLEHGAKNGTAWRPKSTFHCPILGPSGGTKMRPQNRKNPQQRPTRATTKNCNCVYSSNQQIELEQRRSAHAKPDFHFPAPEMEMTACGRTLLSPFPSPMCRLEAGHWRKPTNSSTTRNTASKNFRSSCVRLGSLSRSISKELNHRQTNTFLTACSGHRQVPNARIAATVIASTSSGSW